MSQRYVWIRRDIFNEERIETSFSSPGEIDEISAHESIDNDSDA
jgi:hypothetical protein